MNRTLLFSFRKVITGIPGYTYTLYDVYYYYDGGYVGFDRQDLQRPLTVFEKGIYPDQSGILGTYSGVELCISGFLTRFKAVATTPYGQIETTTTPCGVVCDIAITAWEVTDATTAEALDGEILVTASTSHGPLEYRLDNGPLTDYQPSNLFTGLDGDTIYYLRVRDAAGCVATQAVRVGITPVVYGEKYRIEYTDKLGRATRISIEAKGYSGEVVEKCGLVPATVLSWQGQGNGKYKELHPSEATLGTLSATNFELLGLFSSDDRQHRVTISKGPDYDTLATFWQGWVLPDYYAESYASASNYPVTIKASDALGDLRNHYFLNATKQPIFEQWSQLAIIRFCLEKTGLSLPIYTGLNTFESRLPHGPSDDILALSYLDTAGFYTYSDDADPEPFSLLVVLEKVLNKAGCRLYQYGGAWHIISVDEAGGAYRRRLFDAEGAFVSADTPNNVRPLGAHSTNTTDVLWVGKQQTLEITPACKIISLLQDYGLKNNLVPDGFFTPDAYQDETHLKKWSGTAIIQSANRQGDVFVSPVYGGSTANYVPPKASSGKAIKKTVAKKAINGVDILGSYNDIDALGRVLLFEYNALFISGDDSSLVRELLYWNTLTQAVERVRPSEQDVTLPNSPLLVDTYATYQFCEGGFVVRFKMIFIPGEGNTAVKEVTTTACPITYGVKTYLDSTGVLLHQNASHQLAVSFNYSLLAPIGRNFTEESLAPLFRIRLQIKMGSYYLVGDEWTLTSGYNEITPSKLGTSDSYDIITGPVPMTGLLTVRIFQAVYVGTARYPYMNQVRLRVNSVDIDLLIDREDPPADQLLSAPISEKFNQVPDQIEVTHGDLPQHNNAEVIYRGGIYVHAPPVGLAYTGWVAFSGFAQTIFRGTGSQGDTQLFLTGKYAYLVREGNTLDDKEGPYLIIGTETATGDLILQREFFVPDSLGTQPGRVYRAEEFDSDARQLSDLWQRYHADGTTNGATSQLLRILLQNQALNYSRPTQVLRGSIKGAFAFGQCISDPANNPGKVFLITGGELADEACRWTGEWVEIITGDPGGFDTNPPPEEQLAGTRVWEDGSFRDWEDKAWAEWENYQH